MIQGGSIKKSKWDEKVPYFNPFWVAHFLHFYHIESGHICSSLLTVGWQKSWPGLLQTQLSLQSIRIRPLEHLNITVNKLLKIHLRRNVCPGCFLKTFHWYLWEDQENSSITTHRIPDRSRPSMGRSFGNFLTHSLHLYLYGCTRVT